MPIGHAGTVSVILADIRSSGPITFARFMEHALYHPEFGYYTRPTDAAGEDRIGWDGDYYTSFDVHPILAQALARQVRQIDEQLGSPDPFTVVEMGPGKGLLARDFLAACEKDSPTLFARLRYVLIERSPAMIAEQRRVLAPWLVFGNVSWLNSLSELTTDSLTGVVLSNELVDAFPVHRIRIAQGEPREVYVDEAGGRFVERLGPLSTPDLSAYLRRLAAMDITLPEGYTTEINLEAMAWMREVARVLGRGMALTIDYGHTAQDRYGPARSRGTLLCYWKQLTSEDPLTRVGLQDLTAHVDFTTLVAVGEKAGLHLTGFTNQMSFLMSLGVEQALERLEPGSKEFQSIVQLLRPDGMGRTFKVLIQHKGLPTPALDGLQFKPFFGSALAAGANG
ncbi:MAG: class I SAM-dependent methyltransferase [Nitrospiraceae bacterium]